MGKVSGDLPLELLGPLGCGLQTGAGAVLSSLRVPANTSIAILGTGAVGFAAVMAARAAGASPIIGVDLVPKRLALAMELAQRDTIDARKEEIRPRIAEITGSGVDYVLEITALPEMSEARGRYPCAVRNRGADRRRSARRRGSHQP